MNRINICKNIIQSIRDYITNPDTLDAYREKNPRIGCFVLPNHPTWALCIPYRNGAYLTDAAKDFITMCARTGASTWHRCRRINHSLSTSIMAPVSAELTIDAYFLSAAFIGF